MVGREGKSISAVKKMLTSEGLSSPGRSALGAGVHPIHHQRRRLWAAFHEEVAELVTPRWPPVSIPASAIGSGGSAGGGSCGRRSPRTARTVGATASGAPTAYKPREEWIAVPVPDYGIICGLAPEARPDPLYRAPDIYHASPYDTYYCITVGVWNPLLERTRFFERIERLLRRFTAGTDPRLRVER
jgi:hypothetical protein